MAKPSLQIPQQELQLVREALVKQGMTQKTLAEKLRLHRSVISAFLRGKPVLLENFLKITEVLGFERNWEKLGVFSKTTSQKLTELSHENDIDTVPLVREVRSKVKSTIEEWCGTMRVLDMEQPIEVNEIYTEVNVLEKLTGNKRKTINELRNEFNLEKWEDFERFGLSKVIEQRVSGLETVEKYKKLLVLGKPGAGKTTFLKYLAIQCIQEKFQPNLVPIFISLKYFAEALNRPSLLKYIENQLSGCNITSKQIEELLRQKSILFLLDGLDEVKTEEHERTFNQIREISRIFPENHFVITCRIAVKEYGVFDKFTEVEVADFDEQQIEMFVKNWFKDLSKSKNFLKSLKENARSYQLAVTPLLLTLFCLVFEESGYLPQSRSLLYTEGINILLRKWDVQRRIKREGVYENLSPSLKFDLLSQLGFDTFEKCFFTPQEVKNKISIFLKQIYSNRRAVLERNEIQVLIENPLEDLSYLDLETESFLKSIEAQHGLIIERARGIYSFSHLTFHEYFTASEIVVRQRPLEQALKELLRHLSDKRWREVFLLAAELSKPDSSILLTMMKKEIDRMLAGKKHLQDFLKYINETTNAFQCFIKPASVRAFYFDIDFDIDPERQLSLLLDSSANYLVCGSFFARVFKDTNFEQGVDIAQSYDKNLAKNSRKICEASSANETMYIAVKYALESKKLHSKTKNKLKTIYEEDFKQTENDQLDEEKLKHLADESRSIAKKSRHIGSDSWQFNDHERQLLKQYYEANTLLVECLHTDCLVSPEIHQEILDTLLLPVSEIQTLTVNDEK